MDLRPGDSVFGRTPEEQYHIERLIGGGAFGAVYEVGDAQGNKYALKTIITATLDDANLRALINEGNLAAQVRHENVVAVLFFHDGQQYPQFPPYMIMELSDGGTLESTLQERRKRRELFSNSELRAIFSQIASGLQAVNKLLVHRDIKPDNILFTKNIFKIADFGLSKIVGAATRTQTFKGINHIRYCAPEAWRLDNNLPSMDMYSAGITFYEVSTLQYPYKVDERGDIVDAWRSAHMTQAPIDPRQYNPGLDTGLTQLIMKMMAKRPEDRFSSWEPVIQRLQSPELLANGSQRDVTPLINLAIDSQRKNEEARLAAANQLKQHQEYDSTIEYALSEIRSTAQEIVNAFNQASEFAKLKISDLPRMAFIIHLANRPPSGISVTVMPVYGAHKLDGKEIRAWGFAKSPSGRGFNLILISGGTEDLYGTWETFHVKHSIWPNRNRDRRLDPFPFEMNELPEEIQLLGATHIYQTERSKFNPSMLDPLIAELLDIKSR